MPLKYINKVFYIYGDFCSLECGARFVFDNLKEINFSEIFPLINLYNNMIYNTNEKIKLAQDTN